MPLAVRPKQAGMSTGAREVKALAKRWPTESWDDAYRTL
jgi:hypothetical protein